MFIDIPIKNLELVVRITELHRRLSLVDSRLEATITLALNGTCWSNLVRYIYNLIRYNHGSLLLWQTVVTIVPCLSDFDIILASGVPQDDATTRESYISCTYGSIIITGMILLVVLNNMIWWRNTYVVKNMPRKPNTIGTVCGYLCGSKLVREVNEIYGGNVSLVLRGRRKFTFGKTTGTDGKIRWSIYFKDEKQYGGDQVVED